MTEKSYNSRIGFKKLLCVWSSQTSSRRSSMWCAITMFDSDHLLSHVHWLMVNFQKQKKIKLATNNPFKTQLFRLSQMKFHERQAFSKTANKGHML